MTQFLPVPLSEDDVGFLCVIGNSQYPEKCWFKYNNTVEPLINGHIGNRHFVFYGEVVLSSDVEMY